jgi:hypothetical protein
MEYGHQVMNILQCYVEINNMSFIELSAPVLAINDSQQRPMINVTENCSCDMQCIMQSQNY